MSEYESLRNDLDAIHTSMVGYSGAVDRYAAVVNEQVKELWDDNAALRDELHAVANRLENLTRAVMAEPADVAQAIVNHANRETLREVFVCRTNPGCNLSDPHIHHSDGAVIRVESSEHADIALAEQDRVRRMYPQAPS